MAVIQITPDILLQYGTFIADFSTPGEIMISVTFDEPFAAPPIAVGLRVSRSTASQRIVTSENDNVTPNTLASATTINCTFYVIAAGSSANLVGWWAIGVKKRGAVYAR